MMRLAGDQMPLSPANETVATPADRLIFEYLTNGGSAEMGVNGSVTPVVFTYTATTECSLERLNLAMVDAANEDVDGFFTLAALTNGLLIETYDSSDTLLQDFGTTAVPIKRHADLANLAGTDTAGSSSTPAATRFGVRWTFAKAGAAINLRTGDYFQVTVRDDLSTIGLRMMIQGVLL